ncbi:MAG: type II secretion system F family protein [Chloroflexi bacterium]|nr:type II secretion system F family protein [Chloroflexota bacterium]
MTETLATLILSVLAMLSIGLLFVGLTRLQEADPVQSRLTKYAVPARSLEELELRQPFSERIIKPIVSRISSFLMRRTPPKTVEAIKRNLVLAGNPYNMDVRDYLGIKGLLALLLGGMVLLIFVRGGNLLMGMLFSLILGAIGYYVPNIWLSSRVSARKKEIVKTLPDALDLLTVCVEAGLGFDSAMFKVSQKWDNALSHEFSRVLSEIRMGKTRRESLRALVARTDVQDIATFVGAIIQADQLGVSIAKVLQIQSEQMRTRRRQRAEELAHQAPIKMIFPMVFLIFPSIYVIVLGPAIPTLVKGLVGK